MGRGAGAWSSGYDVSLTRRRSPVRIWARPLGFSAIFRRTAGATTRPIRPKWRPRRSGEPVEGGTAMQIRRLGRGPVTGLHRGGPPHRLRTP